MLRPLALADAADMQRLAGVFEVAGTTRQYPASISRGAATRVHRAQRAAWRDDRRGHVGDHARRRAHRLRRHLQLVARAHGRVSLGYWIAHQEWNRGYATEARAPLVAWAFADGLHRVEATHLTRNPASGRVMQKLGMRARRAHARLLPSFRRWENVELYAILAGE